MYTKPDVVGQSCQKLALHVIFRHSQRPQQVPTSERPRLNPNLASIFSIGLRFRFSSTTLLGTIGHYWALFITFAPVGRKMAKIGFARHFSLFARRSPRQSRARPLPEFLPSSMFSTCWGLFRIFPRDAWVAFHHFSSHSRSFAGYYTSGSSI